MVTEPLQITAFQGLAVPSLARPDTFPEDADAWNAAFQTHQDQANALSAQLNAQADTAVQSAEAAEAAEAAAEAAKIAAEIAAANAIASPSTNGTSATALTLGAASHAITTQTGKSWAPGMWLNCSRTSDGTKRMTGYVGSYNSGTGALVLVVAAGNVSGTGTFSDWTLTISGPPGSVLDSVDLSSVGPSVLPAFLASFVNTRRMPAGMTYTMPSEIWVFSPSGLIYAVPPGLFPVDYDPLTGACLGYPAFEGRTNAALYSRDLTNAAWVAFSMTTARTQTGLDGVANSATLLTATGANAALIQGVALASSARFFTAYVKRVTGTGTVQMTQDNGATWTDITASINTSNFVRCRCPAQTIANPQFGFRLGTSGDAIAVDFVQNENGSCETPPIPTTSAAVSRSSPSLHYVNIPGINSREGTLEVYFTAANDLSAATAAELSDGTVSNLAVIMSASSGGVGPYGEVVSAGATQAALTDGNLVAFSQNHAVLAYKQNDFAFSRGSRAAVTDSAGTVPALTSLYVGRSVAGTPLNGWVAKVAYYPRRLSNTELSALSAL